MRVGFYRHATSGIYSSNYYIFLVLDDWRESRPGLFDMALNGKCQIHPIILLFKAPF